MPAKRKSIQTLALNGALARNPGRHTGRSPSPKPTGPLVVRPDGLTAEQLACWDRIIAIAPAGTLTCGDEIAVEAAARLWARIKAGSSKAADFSMLAKYLSSLGLTPQSRTTIEVPAAPSEENEFAKV